MFDQEEAPDRLMVAAAGWNITISKK